MLKIANVNNKRYFKNRIYTGRRILNKDELDIQTKTNLNLNCHDRKMCRQRTIKFEKLTQILLI